MRRKAIEEIVEAAAAGGDDDVINILILFNHLSTMIRGNKAGCKS